MLPRTARVSFNIQSVTDTDEGNPWYVTQHFWLDTTVGEAEMPGLFEGDNANVPMAWIWNSVGGGAAGSGGLRAALPTAVRVIGWETAARLAGDSPGDADYVSEHTRGTPVVGTRSGTPAATPLAMVLQKNVSGPLKRRGRNYLPLNGSDVNFDGSTVGASRTAVADAMTLLLSNSTLDAVAIPIVSGSDGNRRVITSFSCSTLVGVQRRRLR